MITQTITASGRQVNRRSTRAGSRAHAYPLMALLILAFMGVSHRAHGADPLATDDPFLWLEDLASPRALEWVASENTKTLEVLEQDPRYPGLYAQALAIAEAKDRLPQPQMLAGAVYNLWQDADHVRGIWRQTSVADYIQESPAWHTVLDVDALAQAEGANWFFAHANCRRPQQTRCLVSLSDGGEDAVSVREFDLASGTFVPHGFELSRGKQTIAWVNADKLLVAREWGADTLTASGYPFVVKALKRGQALADAHEIFRGAPTDVAVHPVSLVDGEGRSLQLLVRAVTFFESEIYLVAGDSVRRLALPAKSSVEEFVAGRLLVQLNESWSINGAVYSAGSLVSLELSALQHDPVHLRPTSVYVPGPTESLGEIAATRNRLVITSYESVRGRVAVYAPRSRGAWSKTAIAVPDFVSVEVAATDTRTNQALVQVQGYLTPSSMWLLDSEAATMSPAKQLPAKFDASHEVVEQFYATSLDGTRVPYFVVHRADMAADSSNPTILYAYGGFQVSETPIYSTTMGKLWLERGGAFVVANIRGGGEFGPSWHEAGLKTNRQRIYDDFAAVATDLIARHITSPRRLGIQGGSNGGLLMGVEFTQHPELFSAVDIQVPLLDMLHFEQIAAGPSWVGEYGSVSNPRERDFLAQISPYNNLKAGVHYPEPLVWTTTKDDRVGPQHARKFAAKLNSMGLPYFFYEVTEGGHGSGANLKERAHTGALEMTYFTRQLMD